MENCVKDLLHKKGYKVNEDALSVIRECDDWYANRPILEFHNRKTVQGQVYDLERMNFAKRCCSDDANLCEVVEINAGKGEQGEVVRKILEKNRFDTQYRRQLERVPANGTAACYIRLDNATIYDDGHADGGEIRLNYVDAMGFMPLTVENGDIVEAACSGNTIVYTYPVLMDTTGEQFAAYGVYALPTTFMIDRDGNVFGYVSGQLTEEIMLDIIRQTMEGRRS